jgi:hypothetical protein
MKWGGDGVVASLEEIPSGAEAHVHSAWLMYGLKPVPFKLNPGSLQGDPLADFLVNAGSSVP